MIYENLVCLPKISDINSAQRRLAIFVLCVLKLTCFTTWLQQIEVEYVLVFREIQIKNNYLALKRRIYMKVLWLE